MVKLISEFRSDFEEELNNFFDEHTGITDYELHFSTSTDEHGHVKYHVLIDFEK